MIKIVGFGKKRIGMSHEDCVQYHREKHVPLVTHMLGSRLKSYTVYYVDRALHLTDLHGSLLPYDIIVFAGFEDEFWKGMEAWRKSPEGIKMTEDEKNFIERDSAIALECQMHAYIP